MINGVMSINHRPQSLSLLSVSLLIIRWLWHSKEKKREGGDVYLELIIWFTICLSDQTNLKSSFEFFESGDLYLSYQS